MHRWAQPNPLNSYSEATLAGKSSFSPPGEAGGSGRVNSASLKELAGKLPFNTGVYLGSDALTYH